MKPRLLLVLTLCLMFLGTWNHHVQGQRGAAITFVTYSNDPNSTHFRAYGGSVAAGHRGRGFVNVGGCFELFVDGEGVITPGDCGASGVPAGRVITASGAAGGASCTMQVIGSYKYCNVGSDNDGDGINNENDGCPDAAGKPEFGGCQGPNPNQNPPPPQNGGSGPAVVLKKPDANAACNLTSAAGIGSNLRETPSASGKVLGSLQPTEGPLTILASQESEGFTWYQVKEGDALAWVRADVVQVGGTSCDKVGAPSQDTGSGPVTNVPLRYIPIKENAEIMFRIDENAGDVIDKLFNQCQALAPTFLSVTNILGRRNFALATETINFMRKDSNPCRTLGALRIGKTPQELPEATRKTMMMATCLPNSTEEYQEALFSQAQDISLDLLGAEAPCGALKSLLVLGGLKNPQTKELYSKLNGQCSALGAAKALEYVRFAIETRAALPDLLTKLDDPANCEEPNWVNLVISIGIFIQPDAVPQPPDPGETDPLVLALASCPTYLALLQNISPPQEVLDAIIAALSPCKAADDYLNYGDTPAPPEQIPPATAPLQSFNLPVLKLTSGPIFKPKRASIGLVGRSTDYISADISDMTALVTAVRDNPSSDVYLLTLGEVRNLTQSEAFNDSSPFFNTRTGVLTYFSTDADGKTWLVYHTDLYAPEAARIPPPEGYTFSANSRITSFPGSAVLWLVVQDSEGRYFIARVNVGDPACQEQDANCLMTLELGSADNPNVIGGNLFYQRLVDGQSLLEYQNLKELSDEGGAVVASQPEASSCFYPSEWSETSIAYICDIDGLSKIYVGALENKEAISLEATRSDKAANLYPVRFTRRYLVFDDGQSVFRRLSMPGGEANQFIRIGNVTTNMRWIVD
jgi:Bacterial SH3 domain